MTDNGAQIKPVKDMKEEILSIASDLREGHITSNEAKNLLLVLFGVVERSEQLVCDCKNCKPLPNHAAGFRKNKTCIKDEAN